MLDPQAAESDGGASPFRPIPAIDLLDNSAVRLDQGRFDRVHRTSRDPFEMVATLREAGTEMVHVVDLGAARSGALRPALIERLVDVAGEMVVQVAGGVRSIRDVDVLLRRGATRVVVGTLALESPATLAALASYGECVVVALDSRGGKLGIHGWTVTSEVSLEDAARICEKAGIRRLMCTAIERDGTFGGPDLELLARLRRTTSLPIIMAGGIRSTADLAATRAAGAEGAIVGRAVLEGTISLDVFGSRPFMHDTPQ